MFAKVRGKNPRGRLVCLLAVIAALLTTALLSGYAAAHGEDEVSVNRAGPVRRGRTSYKQVKEWFGEPRRTDRYPYQCIRVIEAIWPGKMSMLFATSGKQPMVVAIIKRPVIHSDRHGDLKFHTGRNVHVGDSAAQLKRKYPNARRHDHRTKTHYILVSTGRGRLEATTSRGRVTELRTFPYEAC